MSKCREKSLTKHVFMAFVNAFVFAASAWCSQPEHVELQVAQVPVMGQPLGISLLLDTVSESVSGRLHYRAQGFNRYSSVKLVNEGSGKLSAEIPAEATRSLAVNYYVELHDNAGDWKFALGSQALPLQKSLGKAQPTTGYETVAMMAVSALLPLGIGAVLWYRERRKRLEILVQIFWMRTLFPLLQLRGRALSEEVSKLTIEPLDHPVKGPTLYRRSFIIQTLQDIHGWDVSSLEEAKDRYLGPGVELPPKPLMPASTTRPRPPRPLSQTASTLRTPAKELKTSETVAKQTEVEATAAKPNSLSDEKARQPEAELDKAKEPTPAPHEASRSKPHPPAKPEPTTAEVVANARRAMRALSKAALSLDQQSERRSGTGGEVADHDDTVMNN